MYKCLSHLSGVLFHNLDDGLCSFSLLQQLQAWSVRIWDVAQPVLPVEISSMLFTGQQWLWAATINWDL